MSYVLIRAILIIRNPHGLQHKLRMTVCPASRIPSHPVKYLQICPLLTLLTHCGENPRTYIPVWDSPLLPTRGLNRPTVWAPPDASARRRLALPNAFGDDYNLNHLPCSPGAPTEFLSAATVYYIIVGGNRRHLGCPVLLWSVHCY